MLNLLTANRKTDFDNYMAKSLDQPTRLNLNFRMRPYGFTSYYDTYKAAMQYNLKEVASQIQCPMLITEPANEAYWPGQSRQLYDLLTSPKKLAHFLRKPTEPTYIANPTAPACAIYEYSIGSTRH